MDALEVATLAIGPINNERSKELQKHAAVVVQEQAQACVRHGISRWTASGDFDAELCTDVLAAMFAFRELDAEVRESITLHPAFRYWVQAMRRTSRGDQPDKEREFARALPDFIWAEQAISGKLARAWTVWTDSRGGLRCPGRARYIELGNELASSELTVEPDSGGVVLRNDHRRIELFITDLQKLENDALDGQGYSVSHAPLAADNTIELWSRDPWLRVAYTGTNQRTTGVSFFGTRDELYPEIDPGPFRDSLAILNDVWPEQYADLALFTRVIVPMQPTPDAHKAFTVSSRQGAIFVDAIDPQAMVENLIHENAHVKLRQIQLIDSLLTNQFDDDKRFPVPWRPDARPIPGILEGLWVFSHVAEYRWRLFEQGRSAKRLAFDSLITDLQAAHSIIKDHASLTPTGEDFVVKMGRWLEDLSQRL